MTDTNAPASPVTWRVDGQRTERRTNVPAGVEAAAHIGQAWGIDPATVEILDPAWTYAAENLPAARAAGYGVRPCLACGHAHDPESAGDCAEAACVPACEACAV